eukprot:TRINITY_DN758_c1_g1_i1.p1 TRINITY_DN758_c1_g1~~TRINITY_DN758_c1_g1_i1.p1  ORF type:complete len:291 (-),score=151.88 TRINITY_DN758_c1_g1_i1:93-914(-)
MATNPNSNQNEMILSQSQEDLVLNEIAKLAIENENKEEKQKQKLTTTSTSTSNLNNNNNNNLNSPTLNSRKSKKNIFQIAKQNLAVSVASSGIGKTIITSVLPNETQELLKCMFILVEQEASKKEAKSLEDKILKWLVKLAIDHQAKRISYKQFRSIDGIIRQAFELFCNVYDKTYAHTNNHTNVNHQRFIDICRPKFQQIEQMFLNVQIAVNDLIKSQLDWDTESLALLPSIITQITSTEFLLRCWTNPSLEAPLFELYHSMLRYTQFHYYE